VTLHRTFIGVELSDAVRRRAADLQEQMRAAGARLRWVRPQNLHFTLRFLGEIPAAQVARAVVATREALRMGAPFVVTLAGLGAFPSFERPQVVWIGTSEGAGDLEQLAQRIDDALGRERFVPDARRFRPHLTLGRTRDDRQWGELVRALHRFQHVELGRERIEAVAVMESVLTTEGPIYTLRERVTLGHGLSSPPG
jgi:2'-5' RNA ligase